MAAVAEESIIETYQRAAGRCEDVLSSRALFCFLKLPFARPRPFVSRIPVLTSPTLCVLARRRRPIWDCPGPGRWSLFAASRRIPIKAYAGYGNATAKVLPPVFG